jgi:hypothetical protein
MRQFRSLFLTCALLALPCSAAAKQETVWSFLGSDVPGKWDVNKLTPPTLTPDGLHINTLNEGFMMRDTDLDHRIDMITIEYASTHDSEALLLFHSRGYAPDKLRQMDFNLLKSEESTTIQLDVSSYKNWDPHADKIGLAFPANADVMLREIRITAVNPFDRLASMLRGLITFDDFRPYTVNFLWGPRLAFTPAEVSAMFTHMPPMAPPANILLYGLIAVAAVVAGSMLFAAKWDRKKAALFLTATLAGCWVLYDVRMGLEFFSYVHDDIATYWSKPLPERIFRVRFGFDAFTESVLPVLTQEEMYVFVASDDKFMDYIRYATYPSLPIRPEQAGSGAVVYAVFDRPDATITEDNRLMFTDGTVTKPGELIMTFDLDSFLFRTLP